MWPQLADPLAAFDPVVGAVGGHRFVACAQQCRHQRHPVMGPQREVVADDRCLDLAVQRDRGDGVFDAGDDQQFELHVVAGVAYRAQAFGQPFGRVDRSVVGEQHGVELLLFGPGHQFLIGQRRRGVEQRCAVAVFGQQPHGQRHLFGEAHRGELVQVAAVGRQVVRARVDPVTLVGAETVEQPPHPGGFVASVQPGAVDDGELMACVVEQIPRVDTGVRRVRHRRQRGDPKPPRAPAVSVHIASVSLSPATCGSFCPTVTLRGGRRRESAVELVVVSWPRPPRVIGIHRRTDSSGRAQSR